MYGGLTSEIFVRDSLIGAPALEPIDLEHARLHVKAISDAEDILIQGWIAAARQYVEEQTNRQLITATWEVWLDAFPAAGRIELPHPPLQEIVSVQYLDGNGDLVSFSDGASPDLPYYSVKAPAGPYAARGWLEPNTNVSWPSTLGASGAVRVQFKAGYGDTPDDVPELLKAVMCFLIGHFEQFRSEVHQTQQRGGSLEQLPFGVSAMLNAFKYSAYPTSVPRRLAVWPWV